MEIFFSGKEVGDNNDIVICSLKKTGILFLVDKSETCQVSNSGIYSSDGLLHFGDVNCLK